MLLRWHSDTPDIVSERASEHYGLGWYLIKLISEEDWDSWPLSRSLSAFKERIFPHNDGGNNIAAAAAAVELTSHRIEPRPPTAPHRTVEPRRHSHQAMERGTVCCYQMIAVAHLPSPLRE